MHLKIYSLPMSVYRDYIDHSVRGKKCEYIAAQLKFSAMIDTTPYSTKDKTLGITTYKIGRFRIITRTFNPTIITTVYWSDTNVPINEKTKSILIKKYKELGLDETGNSFIKEIIDEEDRRDDTGRKNASNRKA